MSKAGRPEVPRRTLHDLLSWLEAEDVAGIVIGGVAASLLGRPRATHDVDVLVWLEESRWGKFLAAGARFGFVPRRRDALRFARKTRVLLALHEPTGIHADIVLGALQFEAESIKRAAKVDVAGLLVPLPTPEDLVVMKAVARRPRDIADIESIVDAHPRLDCRRVRGWLRKFASALDMPEILTDVEGILARRRKRKKR